MDGGRMEAQEVKQITIAAIIWSNITRSRVAHRGFLILSRTD
jgi:hypothetical protein